MAQFIPMAAGAAREAHRGRQERIETENATLANDPNAFAAVLAEREKTSRRRLQLGCGAAVLISGLVAGGVGYGVYQVNQLKNGVENTIGDAIDKAKPDTKVEISAAAAIEKIWFPEDMSLVDGDARATTAADVQEEVFGVGVPGTGLSFGYKSSATVGLELSSPDAIQKQVVENPDGTQSLGLTVAGSEIQATLEQFTGSFVPGTYDEGQLTEWLGSEGDTVDRSQVIMNHAQTTLISCKSELLPYVTEGFQRRSVEQIDAAIATANAIANAKSTSREKVAQAQAYAETLAALREQPIAVTYYDEQASIGSATAVREITDTALPVPNKLSADGIDHYYVTNGQLAVSLGGEEGEVQSATCTLADNVASPSLGKEPSTTISPNEGVVR